MKPAFFVRLALFLVLGAAFGFGVALARAEPLADAAAQAKVDACIAQVRQWAAEPTIVSAVVAHNTTTPAEHLAVTQASWSGLAELDPFVRGFTKNDAGVWLKNHRTDWVTEAFVSDAKGLKVAFLAKTTNWNHAGKPKHDLPMSGQIWQGKIEIDESTRVQQLQVAVPILVDGKPIGSLVVGLSLLKI